MNFDDRLATVLRFRADSPATMRIQYRQLLDLVGTMPADAQGQTVDAALARFAELARHIPTSERTLMIAEPSLRIRSPRLVALLAGTDAQAGRVAVARAELSQAEWLDLIPALSPAARAAMRDRSDLGAEATALLDSLGVQHGALPAAAAAAIPEPIPEPPAAIVPAVESAKPLPRATNIAPETAGDGIGAIVRRIEAYRRAREAGEGLPAAADAPRLPLGEDHGVPLSRPGAFDFASDTTGRIVWTDPGVAPMVIGAGLDSGNDRAVMTAIRRRQPLRGFAIRLDGAPAIAGDWHVDAVPQFDPETGSFSGYRGRFRRPATPTGSPDAGADSDSDRIRLLLHELRTPVNAIQGFAEVIQQQLFGPTPHEYRALAASIAGDAARMLAAFEELERLAKLESGVLTLDSGNCDLAAVIRDTAARLESHAAPRGSGFALRSDAPHLAVTVARVEAERIAWRLLATIAGSTAPGEVIGLRLRDRGDTVRLAIELPKALAALDDEALFTASVGAVPQVIAAGMFGVGFALRLVRAEAQATGGRLRRKGDRLQLDLPALSPPQDRRIAEPGVLPTA